MNNAFNTKLRGKCTVEVLRKTDDSSDELEVIASTTTTNHLHPEAKKFSKAWLSNQLRLPKRGYSNYSIGATYLCLGLNGETNPLSSKEISTDSKIKSFFTSSSNMYFRYEDEPRILLNTTTGRWRRKIFMKFGKKMEVLQDTSETSRLSLSNYVFYITPEKDKPAYSLYVVDYFNYQFAPNAVFTEGTTITSIGLCTGTGFDVKSSTSIGPDNPDAPIWDKLIPGTSLVLKEPLKVGPKDYIRIKYDLGCLIDINVDPETFEKVSLYTNSTNTNYARECLDDVKNGEWFDYTKLKKLTGLEDPTCYILQYAILGACASSRDRAGTSMLVQNIQDDSSDTYFLDEYKGMPRNYFTEGNVTEGNRLIIQSRCYYHYNGRDAWDTERTGKYADWPTFSDWGSNLKLRKPRNFVYPADAKHIYTGVKKIGMYNPLLASLFIREYEYYTQEVWLLKDSAVEKDQFNRLVLHFNVDENLTTTSPEIVQDYNPETDGELPE